MKRRKKSFNDLVYSSLRENKSFSLTKLFESNDSDDNDSDSKDSGNDNDLFSTDDENTDMSDSDNEGDESEEGESEEDKGGNADDSDDIEFHATQQTIKQLNSILKSRDITPGDTVASITSESYVNKSSISKFMMLEKDDPDEFVSDLKNAIEKNDDLIKTIKKQKADLETGTDISVENEVRIAIDKLIHFKEKVDIIDLIEELFINKIKLIAPVEKIESTIEEFIELYRDEVHKNRAKIDIPGSKHYNDEEVYLDKGGEYNGAVGAKSQG